MQPYREIHDATFIWLKNEFLPYLDNSNDNPDLKQFGYQSNTLRIQRSVAPVTGNTKGGHKQKRHVSWSKVYDDPLPKQSRSTK